MSYKIINDLRLEIFHLIEDEEPRLLKIQRNINITISKKFMISLMNNSAPQTKQCEQWLSSGLV